MPRILASTSGLLGAAVAGVMALSGCGAAAPAPPQRPHGGLQSILEDEAALRANPAQAFALFHSMGIDRARVYVAWDEVAPSPNAARRPPFTADQPGSYPVKNWAPYDAIVRAAAAAGVGIDLTVGAPPPLWAGGPGAPHGSRYAAEWMPSASDFRAFMTAIGRRYGGHYVPPGSSTPLPKVDFWSIWNEPNYGPYLAPQTIDNSAVEVSPRLYRALLDAAWSGLAATGHSPRTDTILIGETAPRGLSGHGYPGRFSGMVPLRFIRALYCVDANLRPLRGAAAALRGCPTDAAATRRFPSDHPALFQAAGFADHPYPDLLAPNVRTPPPVGTGYADFAALSDLERTLDGVTAAYGVHVHFPIYSTEFGYRTRPPGPFGLPLALAARYLNQSEYLSWLNPRIRSYDQYLLTDPPAGASNFVTGLEFADGRPKPQVYDAYLMPLFLPATSGPVASPLQVWGGLRPDLGGEQHVQIQFARSASAPFRTIRTLTVSGRHGYFDVEVHFPASGLVRTAWQHSGLLVSRVQRIALSR